jgi:hypothetical protein
MSPPPEALPTQDIPWGNADQWAAANNAVAAVVHSDRAKMAPFRKMAMAVSWKMAQIHAMADALALATCRFCPDPCCESAAPWFDLRDLLLVHGSAAPAPPGQPICRYGDVCRYLGPTGCRLPRPARPWICAWYTCPVQRSVLARVSGPMARCSALMAEIQQDRKQLERLFINLTTSSGGASSRLRDRTAPTSEAG